jgi:hypothetical protein
MVLGVAQSRYDADAGHACVYVQALSKEVLEPAAAVIAVPNSPPPERVSLLVMLMRVVVLIRGDYSAREYRRIPALEGRRRCRVLGCTRRDESADDDTVTTGV